MFFNLGLSKTFDSRRGFSLMEIAIVVALIGVILGGIWYAAAQVGEADKENHAAQELQEISQNILGFMQNRSFNVTSGTSILANMIGGGVIPGEAVVSATTAQTPWGGVLDVSAVGVGVSPPKSFRVSFYGVSEQACVALILKGTNCSIGSGCPTKVLTNGAATSQTPSGVNGQWNLTSSTADSLLCTYNNGSTDPSVEFDYSLVN